MTTTARILRVRRIAAWSIFGLFLLGLFVPFIGMWTGPILGLWFVGTQRPMRGFVWLMVFALVPNFVEALIRNAHRGGRAILVQLALLLVAALFLVLPLTFHRVVSPLLPGFLKTLPFPLAAAVSLTLASLLLPAGFFNHEFGFHGLFPLAPIAAAFGIGAVFFVKDWLASLVVFVWNRDFKGGFYGFASVSAMISVLILGVGVFCLAYEYRLGKGQISLLTLWAFVPASLFFAALAMLLARIRERRGTPSHKTLDLLRSPASLAPLLLLEEHDLQVLASPAGERFPIRNGIPMLLRPADMTGLNRKYNHLYETIAGFYDDTQRVVCALSGFDRDEYVRSYLGFLEVKPGDRVLETSVGTGLNFKYLPHGVKLFGLDFSGEMLANCQANLRRWGLDADLFQGNAEHLPFADSSFDVVFHVGGINFFNDRAAAIEEMIRVAKPGSLILIADETEEHVQSSFETAPLIGRYFKNRKTPVAPPVDLVPRAMQDVRLTTLNVIGKNRFYALTFRKPAETAPVF
jgi:ubiquinone/menaquinone biosynthesis C-methylase UbiE